MKAPSIHTNNTPTFAQSSIPLECPWLMPDEATIIRWHYHAACGLRFDEALELGDHFRLDGAQDCVPRASRDTFQTLLLLFAVLVTFNLVRKNYIPLRRSEDTCAELLDLGLQLQAVCLQMRGDCNLQARVFLPHSEHPPLKRSRIKQ